MKCAFFEHPSQPPPQLNKEHVLKNVVRFLIQKQTLLYYGLADNLLVLRAIGPGVWNFVRMDFANMIREANACS